MMKKWMMPAFAMALVSAIGMLASCTQYDEGLMKGDLVFVGVQSDNSQISGTMSEAISDATGDGELNFIHVAIIDVDDEGEWVIDATTEHGVDRYPLSVFLSDFTLRDGTYPTFVVKRLRGFHDVDRYVGNARSFCGRSYNLSFVPNDSSLYCSELVRDSYVTEAGDTLFSAAPMNFKGPDGEFPAYWVGLFASLGTDIPQDAPGTNPQDMASAEILETVEVDITEISK